MAASEILFENKGTFLVLTATIIIVYLFIKTNNKTRFPPGPSTLPLLGNILSLEENDGFLNQLLTWSKQHGSVFSLYMGRDPTVIVNGVEAIKELTCQTGLDFASRHQMNFEDGLNPKRLGINDTRAGEEWKRQRKFAHTNLRGMGTLKVSLETIISKEARSLVKYLKTSQGSSLDPSVAFCVTASNIISQLVLGHRVTQDNPSEDVLFDCIQGFLNADVDGGLLPTIFPFLWPIIKHSEHWQKIYRTQNKLWSFFRKEIQTRTKRIESLEGEPEADDFLEAYLINRRTQPEYSLESVYFVMTDLFFAGTENVSNTLTWAVVYLVMYPEIQQKIHDEIIAEIGDKDVTLLHRSGLHYTQAALLEVHRLATVEPLVPRVASRDAPLAGYMIPKGTSLLINLWSLHHDPDLWKDPEQFNPDRFLEDDGTLVKQPENFLPFSAGRRMCLGEGLAKMETFLLFTTLVQRIKFSLPPGQDSIPLDGLFALTRKPKPFEVQISSWSN